MTKESIERSLGRIEGIQLQILEEQKKASLERKEIFRQQEAIRREQELARKQREEQAERLKEVEKNTADFNKWKERGIGAIMLISAAAAIVGGSLAASWQKILDVFK